MESYTGCRVVRGPDWKRNNEDGVLGTVEKTIIAPGTTGMTAVVQWDNGLRSNYRAGYDGCFDLRIFDNFYTGQKHNFIDCDGCFYKSFYGFRWKCTVCDNYDLCTFCYMNDEHYLDHPFLRIDEPVPFGSNNILGIYEKLTPRSETTVCTAQGIYFGAEVKRITENSDSKGENGKVLLIHTPCIDATMPLQDPSNEGKRNMALVKWPTGESTLCRIGYNGQVDITCIKPATYGQYYGEHLPLLGRKHERILQNLEEITSEFPKCINGSSKILLNADSDLKPADKKIQFHDGISEFCINDTSLSLNGESNIKSANEDSEVEVTDGLFGYFNAASELSLHDESDLKVLVYSRPGKKIPQDSDYFYELQPVYEAEIVLDFLRIVPEFEFVKWIENAEDINVQVTDDYCWPPLHTACKNGYVKACTHLLDKGANINESTSDYDRSPLVCASLASTPNNLKIIQLLLERGADPNWIGDDGIPAIVSCLFTSTVENNAIPLIINAGGNINARTRDFDTPLHFAVQYSSCNIMKYIIDHGGNVNALNMYHESPLAKIFYSNINTFEKAELLIQSGADVNIPDSFGKTCLHLVPEGNENLMVQFRLVKLLTENGASVNVPDKLGNTILHLERGFGRNLIPLVQFVIDNGLNLNSSNKFGETPLHQCLSKIGGENFLQTVNFMIEKGASVNSKSCLGRTPLFSLIYCNNVFNQSVAEFDNILQTLLSNGALLNEQDNMGSTLLHLSCYNNIMTYNEHILPAVIHNGIDVNIVDNYKVSALHMSCHSKIIDFIDVLLKCENIEVNVRDQYGATPLHWAAWHGNSHAIDKLIARGGNMEIDCNGHNPIDVMVMRNHLHLFNHVPEEYKLQYGPHFRIDDNGSLYPYIGDKKVKYGDEFLRSILFFPGLGKIKDDDKKLNVVTEISHFMHRLVKAITELDSRFQMSIIQSGSMNDGSKCGLPDEFDFMLNLQNFSSITEPIWKKEHLHVPTGYVLVQRKDEIPDNYQEFFMANGVLSRLKLVQYLYHLIYAVCNEETLLPSSHLLMHLKPDELSLTGASININLQWRCSYFKEMKIDIDLVPVLQYDKFWPENTRKVKYVSDNDIMITTGCHIALLKQTSTKSLACRVSYTNCEEHILKNLTKALLNGYILAKAIRGLRFFNTSDLEEAHDTTFCNPANIYEDIDISTFGSEVTSYALKMALLHILENEHEEIHNVDAFTVCRKIYKFLEIMCGISEEKVSLPVFFIPEVSYWNNENVFWEQLHSLLQFINQVLLNSE